MRWTKRNSKGRFCKADNETGDLFDLPAVPAPKIGDIMYRVGCSVVNSDHLPPHNTVIANKVEDLIPGPVCYPYPSSPDMPVLLKFFDAAVQKALDATTAIQLSVLSAVERSYKKLSVDLKEDSLDFNQPTDFTEPLFNIGERVFCVWVLDNVGWTLMAAKGVIVGCDFEYEKYIGGLVPGWNYKVYFEERATKDDQYYGDKPGEIKKACVWVPQSGIYRDKDEAQKAYLHNVRRIHAMYSKIINKLHKLKPEDVQLEDKT